MKSALGLPSLPKNHQASAQRDESSLRYDEYHDSIPQVTVRDFVKQESLPDRQDGQSLANPHQGTSSKLQNLPLDEADQMSKLKALDPRSVDMANTEEDNNSPELPERDTCAELYNNLESSMKATGQRPSSSGSSASGFSRKDMLPPKSESKPSRKSLHALQAGQERKATIQKVECESTSPAASYSGQSAFTDLSMGFETESMWSEDTQEDREIPLTPTIHEILSIICEAVQSYSDDKPTWLSGLY